MQILDQTIRNVFEKLLVLLFLLMHPEWLKEAQASRKIIAIEKLTYFEKYPKYFYNIDLVNYCSDLT